MFNLVSDYQLYSLLIQEIPQENPEMFRTAITGLFLERF